MKTEPLKQIEFNAVKTALVLLILLSSLRPAAALFWDANGVTPGAGTTPTGTWGVDACWTQNAGGTAATQGWIANQAAFFSAGSDAVGTFTVTVSGSQTAASLTFEEGNATLSGGSLILIGADGPISVALPATATLNSVLASTTGLTKKNPGTLVLGSANTYVGATAVQGGILQLGASGAIPSGSTLFIGTNTSARATFATGGFDQSLGALSVQGSDQACQRVIDFGDGASALAFADSSGEEWTGVPLLIVNYTPGVDSLRFGTSAAGLTPTQLGLIQFADFANAAGQIDANGYVTPVLPSGSWVQITWSATDNRTYQVQYKDNLDDAGWNPLSPNVVALGSRASTIDTSVTGATRYYRVELLP